jgi:hypothetical protein
MKLPYILSPHLSRKSTFFPLDCKEAPEALFTTHAAAPDFKDFPLPLPSKKSDYTCSTVTDDGAVWTGASNGVTRACLSEKNKLDRVMFFSFERDLPDNDVRNICSDGNSVWVLTAKGVTHIELIMLTAEERADILLEETLRIVDRRGMVSQKHLAERGDLDSFLPHGHSDNDGGFTAVFASGEIFRYAVLKKEKGADHPDTLSAKEVAVRAVEAVLLLMYIHGRGDGFVARTYLCADEPVPDDGLFFRKQGGRATCLETSDSKARGIVGLTVDASSPVPERLAKLYKDLGYTDDDIIYKADTSSDEITLEFVMMWLWCRLMRDADPELTSLVIESAKNIVNHIIDNRFRLTDATGESTTWARWYPEYFVTEDGWDDACLNSAQMLMYLNAVMDMTGEEGRWQETKDYLLSLGYADLGPKHFDRHTAVCDAGDEDFIENIMYGDHMLATAAFYILCRTEKDENLLSTYRKAFSTWRFSIAREFNPTYDFPYLAACPGEELDMERIAVYFERSNISRLASEVSLVGRHDVPVKKYRAGYKESGYVLPPDERFISKVDRNPLQYKNEDSSGAMCVESCYYYTLAYWMGRFYGFIE